MGAIAGALVADAVVTGSDAWTDAGLTSIAAAESLLAGSPTPIDLAADLAWPTAVGLSDAPPPLLADQASVDLIDATRSALTTGDPLPVSDPLLSNLATMARTSRFDDVLVRADGDPATARLLGGMFGLEHGLGAIPARLVSTIAAPDGRRGRRYLCGLTNRLLRIERPLWYDPRNRRGPKEVLPGLWLSNLLGVGAFTSNHPEGLVLSLCDDEGRVASHPHQVAFHLEDTPKARANPSLPMVVDEILGEISVARADGQPVLVHCRHGASRTGLILRILLVEELGLSAEDALTEAQCLWSHTSTWNREWKAEVERRADARS